MKYTHLVSYGNVRLVKPNDLVGDNVISFYCEKCGYVELYNQKILKKLESEE